MTLQPKWASIIAGIALLVIVLATLTPIAGPNEPVQACDWLCGDFLLLDFILNILLFVPLGLGGRLAGGRGRRVLAAGIVLSLLIELLQLTIVPGRDASVLDWMANSVGTAIGVGLASHAERLVRPRPKDAKFFAAAAVGLWMVCTIGGGWAMMPAPTSRDYYGQLVPSLRRLARFEGQLLSARVNNVELPSELLSTGGSIRDELRRGRLHIDAVVRPGPPPTRLAAVARIADAGRQEILFLGQDQRDLVFKVRLRAAALRLRTPFASLAGAFPQDVGATRLGERLSLSAVLDRGVVRLSAGGAGREARAGEVRFNPALTWSLFVPWDYRFGVNAPWLTALWISSLLFPVGYWGAAAVTDASGRLFVGAMIALVGASFVLAPTWFGLAPSAWWHWVVAAAGIAAGAVISRRAARSRAAVEVRSDPARPRVLVG